ncbi:MAG: dihydroorotase family protein [bacterium]|nr:dihydroorotase family protein [bacterium]
MKKLIKNGKIVYSDKIINADIVVNNKGKIEGISSKKIDNFIGEIYDAKGKYILPGLIEVHGHMREPGMEHKEDVPHGTMAALAGGFTTIIDMPNTKPPTVTVDLLKEKINKIYPGRSYVDYAFFMGVASDKLFELEKVNPKDIVGVKVFMAGHETTPTTVPDDKTLGKIIKILAKRNILLAVHAEDQWLIHYYDNKYKLTGRSDASLWSEIRPSIVVISAAARAISLAEQYSNFKLYLLHLSTPEEFALVEAAKKRGMHVYGELVGYQLMFNIKDYKKYGNKIKVAPALRTPEDQRELWKLFKEGKIDVVCSEHTPHEWETKNQPDMWKAQAGTPGIQELLPAMLTGWVKKFGKNKLEEGLMKISLYASENPAQIFGFNTKGSIKVGKDADFSVIETNKKWNVEKKDLFSKCGWSAYEGMNLIGKPIATFLRGQKVFENGKIINKPSGKWIKML